jgi:hypothetical protein
LIKAYKAGTFQAISQFDHLVRTKLFHKMPVFGRKLPASILRVSRQKTIERISCPC